MLVVVDEYLPEGDYFWFLPVVLCELAVPDYFEKAGLVVLEDHDHGVGLVPAHDEVVDEGTDRTQLVVDPDLVNSPLQVVVAVTAEWVRLQPQVVPVRSCDRVVDLRGGGVERVDYGTY